jgi:hypothetical protein
MIFPGRAYNDNSYYNTDRSWVTTITAVTATAVISTSLFLLYPVVRDYGWKGAFTYIWEGDPHPFHIRERKQTLESITIKLERKEKTLSAMEEGLERASLDSIDGANSRILRQMWEQNVPGRDLRKSLALLSHDLDQLAAQIDQVISTEEIRSTKKEMSTRVVRMMERTDTLISFYNHA